MAKALVITEKPSVAQDITRALGGFREHDGYWESEDTVVTFAVGHLLELLEPEEIDDRYKRWTLDVLPILPDRFDLKPKTGQSERLRTIKQLLARDDVDRVVNACDAGREGELIFREIVKYFGARKPIERLWLQSMTTEAIRDGFARLEPGERFEGLAAAAECRSFSDWLIGMNATRALTKRFASRKERTAWSAGRVQTPTLALLVDRELEVLAHVPRPYWRVTAVFEHQGERYEGTWFDPAFAAGDDEQARDDRIFDEPRARAIVAAASGRDAAAGETRKPSKESPPPLFDLTSLQREGNRRFGWSARRTLNAAQRCYERHKILTYPRTDSRCLPGDYRATVDGVLESLAGAGRRGEGFDDYARAAAHLRDQGLENERRIFDDSGVSDHFAIVPTGKLPAEALSGDDRRLFDLVVRRFLGAFHPPAEWERVERVTQVGDHRFRTRARSLQVPGWRAVLPASDGEDEGTLAPLAPGQSEVSGVAVRAREAELHAEETRPPARITEARLLSLMENAGQQIEDEDLAAVLHEKGIGTPATRAEIIENLIRKGYVVRVGKALRPSVKGIRLIDSLRRIHIDRLASPQLTGEMEYHLHEVEKGRRSASDFMTEIATYASDVVDRAKTFSYDELYDDTPLGTCPKGGRPVVERAWFYTCLKIDPDAPMDAKADPSCPNEKCPLLLWKDTSGRYLDKGSVRALLRDGRTGTLDGFTARNGRTYKGHLEIDWDESKLVVRSEGWNEDSASDRPEYEVNPDPLGPCPLECGNQVVETSQEFVCESRLKENGNGARAHPVKGGKDAAKPCGFVLPRTVCKREITRDEAIHYLKTGRTELLTDFTSRFGRPFSATLVLKETGRHGFEFPPRAAGAGKKKGGARTARTAAGRGARRASKAAAADGDGKAPAPRSPKRATRRGARKTAKRPARRKAKPREDGSDR